MPPRLERLDIFFTRGEHWFSRQIRKMTRSPGEPETIANHVGLVGYEGNGLHAWGLEALGDGVKFHRLCERYGPSSEICIFRPLNLTDVERDKIYAEAGTMINARYGWAKIVLHGLDYCLGGKYLFRRFGKIDRFPICSYFVAHAYAAAGKAFNVDTRAASPDDIWDYVVSHPDKYGFVWQQGQMYGGKT